MHLILRCTSCCNFDCAYCFEKKTNKNKDRISISQIEDIYRKIKFYLTHVRREPSIGIEWTGGEPLLLGTEYFEKAFSLQYKYFKNNIRIKNSIQTNGSLINKKYIELFKKYKNGLGISWDVVGNARLRMGAETNDLILNRIKLLVKHGIKFGVITVVTKENVRLMRDIYRFFRSIDVPFHFNFLNKGDSIFDETIQPSMDDLVANSIKAMKEYCKDNSSKKGNIKVANFYEDINLAVHNDIKKARLCTYRDECFSRFISIEPDGSVYPCPTFKSQESYLGNIFKQSFASLMDHPFKNVAKKRRRFLLRNDCSKCEWRKGCNGGCMAEAYYTDGIMKKTVFSCDYRKRILPKLKSFSASMCNDKPHYI